MLGSGFTMKEAKDIVNEFTDNKTVVPSWNFKFYFGIGLGYWVEDYEGIAEGIGGKFYCFLFPFVIFRKGWLEFNKTNTGE